MINGEKLKNDCIQWIKDWFAANGKNCNAIIGISGGKDSTVAAGLLVEALGKDRVIGVLMPNGQQSDIEDARKVCEFLDIYSMEINIADAFKALQYQLHYAVNYQWCVGGFTPSEQSSVNLAPRLRMTTLYYVSQNFNGRVVNTCNLSEDYVGYSTRWGDSVGDFAPLGRLLTDEVIAIGDALCLPYDLVHKVPSDGLCGKTDEDNLGFTYENLNQYIRIGTCGKPEVDKIISDKHEKNLFKMQPIPTFGFN
jgi:NAD+ synthase